MSFAEQTHRRMLALVGVFVVITIVGMVILWPSAADLPESEPLQPLLSGTVVAVDRYQGEVDPFAGFSGEAAIVGVELHEGPDAGSVVEIDTALDGLPDLAPGDRIRLARFSEEETGTEALYAIADFERRSALWLLVGIFVAAVLLVGRWQGLRSLLGLALSLLVVVTFIVPAVLAGRNPAAVAGVGALAIMLMALYLAHGVNEMTTSAVIGTAAALTVTTILGIAFIDWTSLTGFASEEAVFARFSIEGLDLRGLILAGLIIAALGVLDDVTVSQASTVFALHDTDRTLSWPSLFARSMRVGRDHIASVVNTLFLAYTGASLALLVLFSTSGASPGEIVNSEAFAEELVKTIVGSIGLIAAVPFTTALAATVAVRRSADAPPLRAQLH